MFFEKKEKVRERGREKEEDAFSLERITDAFKNSQDARFMLLVKRGDKGDRKRCMSAL